MDVKQKINTAIRAGNMPEKEMEPFISHIRKYHTYGTGRHIYCEPCDGIFEDDAPDSQSDRTWNAIWRKRGRSETPPVQRYVFRVLMLILVLFLVLLALHYFEVIELPG